MTLLHIIDTLCDVTTKQADLLRELVTDLEPYLNYQGQFKIKINKQMNCLTIYIPDGDNGYIIPYKSFLCSTGDDTPLGEHLSLIHISEPTRH